MLILSIESSSLVASVALVKDEIMIAEYTSNQKKTHSQTLLPMIDEIVKMTGTDKKAIDAIAISGGPGSFTGLRIGSATAKGLGLALDKPIINVPTLAAMSYNYMYTDKLICPIMDARRNQVYTAIYECPETEQKVIWEQKAVSVEELIVKLNELNREVIFVGDGIPVFKSMLDEKLSIKHYYGQRNNNRQRAGSLAALAEQYMEKGIIENADEHTPDYLRLSQAERNRKE